MLSTNLDVLNRMHDSSAGHNRNRGTIETENYHFTLSTGTDQPFAIHNSFTLTAIFSMADLIDAHDQDELPGYFLGIDFRNVIPSVAQKQWMVDRIRSGVEKASGIARRYHIKRKFLNVLAKRSRQGIPIREGAGRPRVLDAMSHEAIATNIIDLTCTSTDDLRVEIK